MRRVSFDASNDWLRHPKLLRPISWRTASGEQHAMFEAEIGGSRWAIRLNDFPDEPLYTVLIDGDEIMHFDDWPRIWSSPEVPK